MQQNPPFSGGLAPDIPGRAAVIPMLPTRVRQPRHRAPLPDAIAIRAATVPDPAPRYDDDPEKSDKIPESTSADRATGFPARMPGSERTGSADGWPSQFAQVLAETLAGARPARQLTPWTTEQTQRRIRQLGPSLSSQQRPQIRRVMSSAPAPGVLEITAVVGFGPAVRVLALRLEDRLPGGQTGAHPAGQWRCTALESA